MVHNVREHLVSPFVFVSYQLHSRWNNCVNGCKHCWLSNRGDYIHETKRQNRMLNIYLVATDNSKLWVFKLRTLFLMDLHCHANTSKSIQTTDIFQRGKKKIRNKNIHIQNCFVKINKAWVNKQRYSTWVQF